MGLFEGESPLRPGAELDHGRYRIVRKIGAGGMGAVYEAKQVRTDKRVAIKGIHPAQATSSAAMQRLLREAQAAARVPHPNVVDVYDVILDGGYVFLVMEYLEGEPLTKLLARERPSPPRLIALLLPALRGVAAAHKQGVIHRDLKPDNIFMAREGDALWPTAKVLDFGISKLEARGEDQLSLTGSGHLIGTPKYMSFEQLSGDPRIDARTDVYSVGVILYEGLSGQLPYQADSLPELIYKITTGDPRPLRELRSDLPGTLERIVSWALVKERAERIQSIDALIRELEPFATDVGYRGELLLSETALAPLLAAVGSRPPAPLTAALPTSSPDTPLPDGRIASGPHTPDPNTANVGRSSVRWVWLGIVALVAGLAIYALRSGTPPEARVATPSEPPIAPHTGLGVATPAPAQRSPDQLGGAADGGGEHARPGAGLADGHPASGGPAIADDARGSQAPRWAVPAMPKAFRTDAPADAPHPTAARLHPYDAVRNAAKETAVHSAMDPDSRAGERLQPSAASTSPPSAPSPNPTGHHAGPHPAADPSAASASRKRNPLPTTTAPPAAPVPEAATPTRDLSRDTPTDKPKGGFRVSRPPQSGDF